MNAERRLTHGETANAKLLGGGLGSSVTREAADAHQRRREAEDRRRCSHELNGIIEHLYPPRPAEPSTYGLPQSTLRAYGARLLTEGWTRDEVLTRLAIEPRSAA